MLESGTQLGPYRIESLLGAGGMGEVYLATDTRLNRMIAIKTLQEEFSGRTDWKQRFRQEAQAIAALNHPHICTLHDIGHHEGVDFLVMEYLEGQTLAERLKKGALPAEEALHCALEIADALDKTHRRGVIHGDLKPSNVMLTRSGVKLLDFGLAKLHSAPADRDNTLSGTRTFGRGGLQGTPQYMAPEQVEEMEADARSDIFAFGAVMYEMLTGQKAFTGASTVSVFASILRETPKPLSTVKANLPPSLERLVNTCMAKDPDERWQHVGDIIIQLKAIRDEKPAPEPAAAKPRRGGVIGWTAAILAVGVVSFAIAWLSHTAAPLPALRFTLGQPEGLQFGDVPRMALSRDGRFLAFSAGPEGSTPQLWIRPLDAAEAKPLAGTENAMHPFWSPDNAYVGFVADGKLKRVDVAGGQVTVLCDGPANDGSGTWNQKGVILFGGSNPDGPIMRVSQEGGVPSPVTHLGTGETFHRWPRFLPDGVHFIFLANNPAPDSGTIYIGSLDSEEKPKPLFQSAYMADYASGFLFYKRDSSLVARPFDPAKLDFSGEAVPIVPSLGFLTSSRRLGFTLSSNGYLAYSEDPQGLRHLIWLDRTGKQTGNLAAPDNVSNIRISPDDTQVAFDGNLDVFLADLVRGVQSRITFSSADDHQPVWSRDGKYIAFSSDRDDLVYKLYRKSAMGLGEDELLLKSDVDVQPDDISPDGKFLLFERTTVQGTPPFPRNVDLYALPLNGGPDPVPIPVQTTPFDEIQGRFSTDGRWIAFVTNESGTYQVNVRSFPASERKIQISVNGGMQPRWSKDGESLYFVAGDGMLMQVRIKSLDKFETETPSPLFTMPFGRTPLRMLSTSSMSSYDINSDGSRFLVIAQTGRRSDYPIIVLQNWMASMGRRQ